MNMVRGKYSKRAEVRRDRETLAAEARAAAVQAERAARDRDAVKTKAEGQADLYRKELKSLKAHLAEQTSPELSQALELVEDQRKKAFKLEAHLREVNEVRVKSQDRIAGTIAATFGITFLEAVEMVIGSVSSVTPESWDPKYLSSGGGLSRADRGFNRKDIRADERRQMGASGRAVQRARGHRLTVTDFSGIAIEPDTWIVYRGESVPRSLVAMYSNKQAAQAHAATEPELMVEGWYVLDSHVAHETQRHADDRGPAS